MIQAVKGSAAPSRCAPHRANKAAHRKALTCYGLHSLKERRMGEVPPLAWGASGNIRAAAASATLYGLTSKAFDGHICPTTPSTPINDAHQEGYSFIETLRYSLTSNGIQRTLDPLTLSGVGFAYQHLPHLSTMCTAGGFFLSTDQLSQQVLAV